LQRRVTEDNAKNYRGNRRGFSIEKKEFVKKCKKKGKMSKKLLKKT